MKSKTQSPKLTKQIHAILNELQTDQLSLGLPVKKTSKLAARIILYDHISKLLGVWVVRPADAVEPRFLMNGFYVTPLYKRYVHYSRGPMGKAVGMVCWFPIKLGFRTFEISDGEGKVPFLCNRKTTTCVLEQDIRRPQNRKSMRSFKNKLALHLSQLWLVKRKYKNCWLLADRDFKADDNGEHLYRWIKKNRPEQKAFFALSRKSADWPRLNREGFKLIDIHSLKYFFAYINADWLISSNITDYIYKSNWRKKFADILNQHVCYLQHGITQNFQPSMNRKAIRLLIGATEREYYAFAHDPDYAYTLSSRELRLTGFPRHDRLIEKAKKIRTPKTLLVMPSWRENIVNDLDEGTGKRPYFPYFKFSDFFKNWNSVLQSEALRAAIANHGYRLRFFPHPYIRQQLCDFCLDDETVVDDVGGSIQDILADTALLITDYSSINMEMALIGRPVVYFQFDGDEFLGGGHWVRHGYFDYRKDGFGEVVKTPEALIETACAYLAAGCKMHDEYRKRSKDFFTFTDQNNCRRVYEAIKGVIRIPQN